jgi:hypothetical protein
MDVNRSQLGLIYIYTAETGADADSSEFRGQNDPRLESPPYP